ncbi:MULTISPECIES: class I adenylate-forming enzyme family protein [Mycobacterium]|uniref:Acid--CoA ligase n=1 Tax=Mycobacterium kiyosense TaxID=2871094 RepID=A0A9P3Q3T7_9MYCO|nr:MULTISPECIES: AMP-binding protein [Mycobacterium]BDB44080.1 acid--CoA ligase [Mycobacterium kiyosense]BDE15616.1 acid--CoA ligase [Mycobacterium sp. 20KCMC460]GLB80961.1 acid--CoA ligase [Mycobacterium kiyosense]GLB87279.1 acid--CoA ligase [Mycobacterium kiyosense]GLB93441.1 acid--CoA ligase [Mycobacterium kiyosense]
MAATVGSALHWWARTKGDQPAIILGAEQLSYRQLHDWSGRLARRLVDDGVKPGDRVGVLAPNALQWPVAALGIMKSGAVMVPFNARLKAAEIRKIADDAGLSLLIAAPTHTAVAHEAREAGREFAVLSFDYVDAERTGAPDDFRVDPAGDEPIAVIFTSGSTGLSKGVILTSNTLLAMVLENTLTEEGFRPGTVTLLVLPLAFTPGLVYGLLITTVLGGTLIVEPELNPSRAVKLIEQHSVRAIFGVPLIFESLSRAEEFRNADLSSLQTAIVGGAAVPTDLLKRWADKGVLLRQIYGMTEAGGVATATQRADAMAHPDSCGSGSIFTEVAVVDEHGSVVGPGEHGEIVVRGPGVTPGYWDDPQTTAAAIRDGWLHSGDLGTRDEQGRIKFVDRMKDLIISGGINISPVELEATIGSLDGVAEVAVIVAPDERFGETPAAIITVKPDAEGLDEAAVIAHCERLLSDYKVPRYVVLRSDPLPRLPSGKIAKQAVREEYHDISQRFTRAR